VIVGWLAHTVAGLPLPAAFALGAIVSPPDAVAATAITSRLGVPRRIVTVLEGESLVNDASALVALKFAIAALMTGAFSLPAAGLSFVLVSVGGVAFGLLVGWVSVLIQKWIDDPPVQIVISLLTPFVAYLPGERIGFSGVLAVVTAGLYVGWRSSEISDARTRLQAYPFWEMVIFLLNGIIFILIGLQLPEVLDALKGQSISGLCGQAALISLAVILVRIIWVFPATYLPRWLSASLRKRDPYPPARNIVVVAWTGMRGVVSLAAALALPEYLTDGRPFPGRNKILFFTFSVILATLVAQGLSLPALICWLGVQRDCEAEREERQARLEANRAAMSRLDELAKEESLPGTLVQRLRVEYEERIRELQSDASGHEDESETEAVSPYTHLQQEALKVERRIILALRNQRVISDEVMRRIERDLDLAEARLHLGAEVH
jgi:CPA1 family monovalent cation:H+ antiporter